MKKFVDRPLTDDERKLVEENLGLAVDVAKRFNIVPSRRCVEDLVQSAVLGLVMAAQRFDPTRNLRFSTYAHVYAKCKVLEECHRHGMRFGERAHRHDLRPHAVTMFGVMEEIRLDHALARDGDAPSTDDKDLEDVLRETLGDDAEIVIMHALRGMVYREIGGIVGRSHESVRQKLKKLYAKLRWRIGFVDSVRDRIGA